MANHKAIFISGGASGIGKATALHFAAQGWFVGLADVDEAGLAATAALLPEGKVSTHIMDVRSREAWAAALTDFWAASGGRLDVMFNNAGIARGGAFGDVAAVDPGSAQAGGRGVDQGHGAGDAALHERQNKAPPGVRKIGPGQADDEKGRAREREGRVT